MLKVDARAGVIGKLNTMKDDVSFSNSSPSDYFNNFALAGNIAELGAADSSVAESAVDGDVAVKDTSHGFELDISDKGWMIGRGFLSLPAMEYNARIGAIESSDRGLNPLADEINPNIVVGGSFTGKVDFTGDTDDIRVFLVAGQTYLISLHGTGATPVKDTFLEVYDPTAALVNFDDDGGNDLASIMTITAAATGNYVIRASSFSNPGDPGLGQYTVDVRVQGVDAVGDTNATAVVMTQGSTFGFRETATVSGGADLDRYEVQLEAGKFYTFKLAAGADYATDYTAVPAGEIDTILRLRNAGGTLLASNDDNSFPSDISSGFSFLAQTTGTYYLDVTGYAGQTGGYIVDFNEVDYMSKSPLDAIRWKAAANIPTTDVNGVPTATVYFGLVGETFGEPNLPTTWGWNVKEKAAVMSVLAEYTKITGITYVETLDSSTATFRLQTVSGPNPPVSYGAYFYPQDPAYGTQKGIGVFNINSGGWDKPGASTQDIPGNQVSLDKGGFSWSVIMHEFGHAHGLAHPHDTGGGSDVMLGVTSPTGSYGIFNLNQGVYTVMSYNEAWDFHPDGASPFTIAGIGNGWSTFGAFDIKVLQERYGVHANNTGDNVYTISAVQQSGVYYETIWDTGGTDSIVYSGTGNARIDLTAATLDYSATGAGVLSFVDQIPGTAGADGIWGGYTIANGVVIENAQGGSGADVLIGNAAANRLIGGAGVDTMIGRGGDDTYYVDNAGDVVTEVAGEGSDVVYTSVSYALSATSSIEVMSTTDSAGTGAIDLRGSDFAQTMYGNAGANVLDGSFGVDTMLGFGGDDVYYVDNAGDRVLEAAGGGSDTVYTSSSYTLEAGSSVEVLSVSQLGATTALTLKGNELGQTIYGNIGNNILDGGAGKDYLVGGGTQDGDAFRFSSALGGDNVDVVVDFILGADRIELARSVFSTLNLGVLGTAAFRAGTAAGDADDRIIYDGATGNMYYDADGNGAGAQVLFATLATGLNLTGNEFLVI